MKHLSEKKLAYYPVVLTQLTGRQVVVIGGGPVAERKVRGLLEVGAVVRVVSPEITPGLQTRVEGGRVGWEQRVYQSDDCAGSILVYAATNSRVVNRQIALEAERQNILCNVANAPEEGSFHLPAVHRGADSLVGVSTYGADPAKARKLRDEITAWLGDRDER